MKERKVLIVDDNENVLMALEYNLRDAGYSVLKATNGRDALSIALSDLPDLIVSDITMPEMNGIEFCRTLRSHASAAETPFIFLTAHGDRDERVRGLRSGADDYIVKPFDIEELIARIEILFRKIQKRKYSETLSGSFRELSLPDILQIFEHTRKEGTLIVDAGAQTGYCTCKDGMIMDVSFGDESGEDALAELMLLKEGNFHYEPKDVTGGSIGRPISFVMLESLRLVDERFAISDYIPDTAKILLLGKEPSSEDPDVLKVIAAMKAGATTSGDIRSASGLSRIRVELALGKLAREGAFKAGAPADKVGAQGVAASKPVKLLFAFTDEPSASSFLKSTAESFGAGASHGIKAGIADFLKVRIADAVVHVFSLRGEKKFSFLWEPMLATSDAVCFLVASAQDQDHVACVREKALSTRGIPFHAVTMNNGLSGSDIAYLQGAADIKNMLCALVNTGPTP